MSGPKGKFFYQEVTESWGVLRQINNIGAWSDSSFMLAHRSANRGAQGGERDQASAEPGGVACTGAQLFLRHVRPGF